MPDPLPALASRCLGYAYGKRWLPKHHLGQLSSLVSGDSHITILAGLHFEIHLHLR
ncbi:hypothetical protein F2Q70_00015428 [Brassica cretica]|uniref:Uncharacterized protein n=1 Tax=Brassica cretica TaxID=69181 RepID=A0A3N6TX70_BRACR|nr:hypothetical protein F2Q70_00015428 [Brassica cretica]